MTRRYQDGGEALLEALRSLGVEHIFCSPGSEWAPIWEGIARQKIEGRAGPAYHDLWHESLAVDLALGYALVTGQLQAVLLHAGAGLLQGACAIHGALLSAVPILIMSSESNSYGDRASVDPGSQWYQSLSVVGGTDALVDRIVKWSCKLPGIETFYEFTKRAGEIALRSPQGPVYINASVEVLLEPWDKPVTAKTVPPSGVRVASAPDIASLVEEVQSARHPIIITESAGKTPDGYRALVEFAEAFGIGVYEPSSVLYCNFPKSHALYLGDNPDRARGTTDLILLINCRSPWYPPSNVFRGARVLVVDEVPLRPHMVYQVLSADRYVEGDVAHTLRAAVSFATGDGSERHQERYSEARAALERGWVSSEAKAEEVKNIDPIALCVALRMALPADKLIVDETITHARVVQAHVRPELEGSYYRVQGGLGQGMGVALGAKLGAPRRFVMLTVGDGTFLYNPIAPALAAAREMNLPVLIVIFNNRKYQSMKNNHLRFYPDGASVAFDLFHGVNLDTQPALHSIATSCGVVGIELNDKSEMHAAVSQAVAAVQGGQTVVLNVAVSR